MYNQFEDVIYNKVPSNSFDLSHSRKFSCAMGHLVPVMCQEVVPGDSFSIQQEQLVRMAPMVAPIMDRVNVTTHCFFVPNRILWEGWEDFIANPLDPLNPAPFFRLGPDDTHQIGIGSVGDYLGYPTGTISNTRDYSALPLSAYMLIWNEFYRDQNLQDEKDFALVDGNNYQNADLLALLAGVPYKRAWNKDYFTSALPEPQKGEPVTFPIGGTADVNYVPNGTTKFHNQSDDSLGQSAPVANAQINAGVLSYTDSNLGGSTGQRIDNSEQLEVDLTTASAITVEDFRRAVRLQEWLEINARSGNRYIETIQNHFNVKSDDARLQRPEYLGGGKTNISFSEVLQMSSSDSVTPQGNMAGHGINVGNSRPYRYFAKEHGFIICIMSIQPETSYFNPTPKWATRLDPLEYLWPKFAQLGEQPVYNYEVKGDYGVGGNEVFGWQSRYADYRYNHSTVHGEFKTSLDFWHMARKFETDPLLNEEFVEANPTNRIFAVEEDVHHMYVFLFNRVRARRPLPRYNIPTI